MDQIVEDRRVEQLYIFDDENDRLGEADALALQDLLHTEESLLAECLVILGLRLHTIFVHLVEVI